MATGDEVLHDVIVLGTSSDGDVVLVDVYGSDANVCGTLRFTFRDARERRRMSGLLREWSRHATPVTLVRTGRSVALRVTRGSRLGLAYRPGEA